ncbi:cell division protein FtsQ/DivIB [Staphylococcus petrasii]|uniref:cell division protein FtsQ/DivIB n=1 Tax=Staphylococcus petrasii TaxID=1276936 RepID=UPI000DFFF6BD|nr:FtsQ-type POTRA domain-containing protein [Staphylococcus petrasii]SUM60294.1 putative cell division protein [Staphylococcus petrasii]
MDERKNNRNTKVRSIKDSIERKNRELKDKEIDDNEDSKFNQSSTFENEDRPSATQDSNEKQHHKEEPLEESKEELKEDSQEEHKQEEIKQNESNRHTSSRKDNQFQNFKTKATELFTNPKKKRENRKNTATNRKQKEDKYAHMTLQEKREQQRIDRRKRQKRIQYIILTSLILLILLFLIYMFTPLSRISHINISGNKNLSNQQVEKALDVKPGSRMYTYSKRKGINNLEQNPLVKNVEIKKRLPNTLNVQVTENNVVGVVKDKNKYTPIIEGNKELKDYKGDIAGSGPILDGFKGSDKDNMVKALSNMSSEVRDMISEISYAPEANKQSRILLYMKDGMQVVGDYKTIADKLKYYPQMSQSLNKDDSGNLQTQGYIDLSVGASFIPYNESDANNSKSNQVLQQKTQEENDAKNELQSALNKINEQSDSNN